MAGPLQRKLAPVPQAFGDESKTTRGTITAIHYEDRRLEVSVGDDTVIVPYLFYIDWYGVGDVVSIFKDSYGYIAQGPIGKALSVDADDAPGTDPAPTGLSLTLIGSIVRAVWDTYASATLYRVRTSLDGGSTWRPTFTTASTTYDIGVGQGQTITVQVAAYVSGAWTLWTASQSITYPLPPGSTEIVETTIQPSDSGTWRVGKSNWDSYNTGRWDWPRTVYQGDGSIYGSDGYLRGWAGYGDRIKNLGALEILSITLKVKRNSYGYASSNRTLTVQGTTQGAKPAGAPTLTGDTATTNGVLAEQWAQASLSASMREALRTGAIKGLAATGSDLAGWYGSSGSMALTIRYRKAV